MKTTEIAAKLRRAATDMEALAATDGQAFSEPQQKFTPFAIVDLL